MKGDHSALFFWANQVRWGFKKGVGWRNRPEHKSASWPPDLGQGKPWFSHLLIFCTPVSVGEHQPPNSAISCATEAKETDMSPHPKVNSEPQNTIRRRITLQKATKNKKRVGTIQKSGGPPPALVSFAAERPSRRLARELPFRSSLSYPPTSGGTFRLQSPIRLDHTRAKKACVYTVDTH